MRAADGHTCAPSDTYSPLLPLGRFAIGRFKTEKTRTQNKVLFDGPQAASALFSFGFSWRDVPPTLRTEDPSSILIVGFDHGYDHTFELEGLAIRTIPVGRTGAEKQGCKNRGGKTEMQKQECRNRNGEAETEKQGQRKQVQKKAGTKEASAEQSSGKDAPGPLRAAR